MSRVLAGLKNSLCILFLRPPRGPLGHACGPPMYSVMCVLYHVHRSVHLQHASFRIPRITACNVMEHAARCAGGAFTARTPRSTAGLLATESGRLPPRRRRNRIGSWRPSTRRRCGQAKRGRRACAIRVLRWLPGGMCMGTGRRRSRSRWRHCCLRLRTWRGARARCERP